MKALKITGMALAGLTFFAGTAVFVSWILSLMWNWLMPGIFGLPEITMLQAGGLFILSKLIFTPGMGGGHKSPKSHDKSVWKRKFMSKMKNHKAQDITIQDCE